MCARIIFALVFATAGFGQSGVSRDLGTVHSGSSVRLAAFGDFGYQGSGTGLSGVATILAEQHRRTPYNIGLTLGDNFYPRGVKSTSDPKWSQIWEEHYGKLGIPFYAILGNHDYYGDEQAEVDYTKLSRTWRMPYRYFTFQAGPARFFALDTAEGASIMFLPFFKRPWPDEQLAWLSTALSRYQDAPWKIVYGHHPIYSDGHHGDEKRLHAGLLPLLRQQGVDFYLSGHEHELQHHVVDGVDYLVAGGGGKDIRSVTRKRAAWVRSAHGYLELEITAGSAQARFRGGEGGEVLYEVQRTASDSGGRTRSAPSSQPR